MGTEVPLNKKRNSMQSSRNSDIDDEQLKLEMRAMAELLLDIYEYRMQSAGRSDHDHERGVLDGDQRSRTMKERSTFKQTEQN
jgi:hypothetical protein